MFRIEKKIGGNFGLQRVISVLAALIVAGIVIGICGYNPVKVYQEMVVGAFGSTYYIQQTIQKTIPLLVMGLGVAVCFKMNFINIGAEGQFYMGAVAATYIAVFCDGLSTSVAFVLMFVCAFLAGGAWCLVAGVMKSKWGVSETLVTLMLNYVAIKIVTYLQYVLWKDPASYGFPKIANYPSALQLPKIFGIHAGWIIALVLTVIIWFLFRYMKMGYEMAVMGINVRTARYAGIHTGRLLLISSMIGGGICGLAGVIQASGVEKTLNSQIANGMGYTAIAIAYMAKMNPFWILFVSFLFSILLQGSAYMEVSMQIPSATGDMIQGIILLFVLGSEFFAKYRIIKANKEENV